MIYPGLLQTNGIQAVFTESNRELLRTNRPVPGLNLGTNTKTPVQIVEKNLNLLISELDWDKDRLATAAQVHGSDIEAVDTPGLYERVDGLVTKTPNLILGIRVADCAAVLIADPAAETIGAFHAGWKGAADGIIPKGIKKMMALGAEPARMQVFISPCISLKNFEVGGEVAIRFPAEFVDRKSYQKPHVDLKAFLAHQLKQHGIAQHNIEIAPECTVDDLRFYSYRRERSAAGRMLALIKLDK